MSKIADPKTLLEPDECFVGRTYSPHSVQLIPEGSAYDYASLRARQLNGLLLMMTGDGYETFQQLSDGIKLDMLWLAQQFAAELEDMVDVVIRDAKGGKA